MEVVMPSKGSPGSFFPHRAAGRAHAAALSLALAIAMPAAALAQQPASTAGGQPPSYARMSRGTRWLEGPGVAIKVLVEAANAGGGEVEVAELTLQPASSAVNHLHGSHEILYIVEGVLDHVVNGETHRLEPGMVGIVRQGDTVAHKVVSTTPVRAVIVWAPGGEADRLAKLFKARPVEPTADATSP
jgi:quercetin dioxygenase-like cupin family protein